MMDTSFLGWTLFSPPAYLGLIAISPLMTLLVAWSLIWKGIALWKAARNNQMGWYVAMLILQTAGILEILYILFWQKKRK